ncbi:hypothetical protein [Microbacterium sp. UBA837]|uniref:hypothetical protein n=1 Tax=Microbacterium sp. UBA837 TaxID=1946956 RepID=UPI0026006CEC|nr:hypothetical protein [Microbacterium sp. UBA837]|tara:strand:- start:1490 stop:1660 length:171 start_codon:yes stop_codon:yes gene_type:complete
MTEKKERRDWSTILDILGALLIVAGVALWSIPVALVVAGVAVLLAAHPITVRGWRR